jgi:hypothetical protein
VRRQRWKFPGHRWAGASAYGQIEMRL